MQSMFNRFLIGFAVDILAICAAEKVYDYLKNRNAIEITID